MPSDLMRSGWSKSNRPNGFSLVECLVVLALLGILATLAIPRSSAVQRRLELDSGLRRLRVGLDRGRMAAERDRQPCSLQLTASGWQPPLTGDLPACRGGVTPLTERVQVSWSCAATCRMPFASAPMAWCSMADWWCWRTPAMPRRCAW